MYVYKFYYTLKSFPFALLSQTHCYKFCVNCVVTDGEDVAKFLIVSKPAENYFGSTVHHYGYDREFKNPNMIAPPMINKLNKTWISQLQFRAFMSGSNRCEVASDNIEGTLNT